MKLAIFSVLAFCSVLSTDAFANDCNPNDLRNAAASFCAAQGGAIQNDERLVGPGRSWHGSLLSCIVGRRSRDVYVARTSDCGVSQPCFYLRGRCVR